MREFSKSEKLANARYNVRGPIALEAERIEASGERVQKLNIGNPACFGFTAPTDVIEELRRNAEVSLPYSDAHGVLSAREAIYSYAQQRRLPNVSLNSIYTGNGVSELIQIALDALLNPGDEILIPSPDYPLWTAASVIAGGTVVHYTCDEQSDWYPDLPEMESKITDRTKAIVVINPNNPTGAVYPKEILQGIADIATRHGLIIFSDEIYDRLLLDGDECVSIGSLAPEVLTVTMNGLSKSHMLCGYRIGWMTLSGNRDMAKDYIEGLEMLTDMRLCSNVPGQSVIPLALSGKQRAEEYFLPTGRVYQQRDAIYEAVNSIPGVSAVKPRAAFYIFPKIDLNRFKITDDAQFALEYLKQKKVLVVPGSGFNWKKPDHFRIVYLSGCDELRKAASDLGDFLESNYR